MLRKESIVLMQLILMACVCGSLCLANDSDTATAKPDSTDMEMVTAINKFTFDLFKEVIKNGGAKNVFISPFSVSYALGMTYNGARGTTADAIADVLKYGGLENQEINRAYKNVMQVLTQLDPEVIFEIANSIWYKQGFPVEQEFLDINSQFFSSEVNGLHFGNPESSKIINGWVAEKTHDKIKKIISPPLDPEIVMILINAIYFKGSWVSEFDKANTKEEPFYLTDGSETKCDMMHQLAYYSYDHNQNYTVVNMPYGDSSYSMVAFLPPEGVNVDEVIFNLGEEGWRNALNFRRWGEVELYFPRFKLSYSLTLNKALKMLGMGIAFDRKNADFAGINPGDTLWIDKVLHKTFVQVDEEGTEAAAVTAVVMARPTSASDPPPPPVIRFDRPFVYAIYDKTSGTILFIGKIEKPEWAEG